MLHFYLYYDMMTPPQHISPPTPTKRINDTLQKRAGHIATRSAPRCGVRDIVTRSSLAY